MSSPSSDKPRKNALIIVDMQNDFCPPTGSLAVPGALEALQIINGIREQHQFDLTTLTQDWHPSDHMSFYENNKSNPHAKLFSVLEIPGIGPQMMWPVHCVQGSSGAEFHADLQRAAGDIVVRKGMNSRIDSYSGFFDNDHKNQTEMNEVLKQHGITHVYLVGVATDYCVGYSALDALAGGFDTTLVEDGARGVAPDTTTDMLAQLKSKGVKVINSSQLNQELPPLSSRPGLSKRKTCDLADSPTEPLNESSSSSSASHGTVVAADDESKSEELPVKVPKTTHESN